MIRIGRAQLSAGTTALLAGYQAAVNAEPAFADKVAKAKKSFSQYNKKTNAAFKEVRETLARMCQGPLRCHYCEDSKADEVEHIKPKDWYPGDCFRWANYCYACGPCNGPKNNKFAVFTPGSAAATPLVRADGALVVAPPTGTPVFINPRNDDPLDFLFLDIAGTFFFTELPDAGTREHERARYTIELLGLNSRSYLVQARRNAYGNFRARLREYIAERDIGKPDAHLKILAGNLQLEHHQTVWQEMVRQHAHLPDIALLFQSAPEALGW